MGLPLISPVACVIEAIDKSATQYHASAREPVKGVARSASVTFLVQQAQAIRDSQSQSPSGSRRRTMGYLVTRQWMLDDISYDPQPGDMITAIGSKTGLKLYVTMLTDKGHLDGANTLVFIHYSDRRPEQGSS